MSLNLQSNAGGFIVLHRLSYLSLKTLPQVVEMAIQVLMESTID